MSIFCQVIINLLSKHSTFYENTSQKKNAGKNILPSFVVIKKLKYFVIFLQMLVSVLYWILFFKFQSRNYFFKK